MAKRYLGDSVYASKVNGMIELTVENGAGPTNTIYLEDEVLKALVRYAYDDKVELKLKEAYDESGIREG